MKVLSIHGCLRNVAPPFPKASEPRLKSKARATRQSAAAGKGAS